MRIYLIALMLLLAATPGFAQHLGARGQWQPEIADTDARLQQTVEIEVLGRAAVPALQMLTDKTGVSLSVAPEDLNTVGERKLTIIAKGLDLKAIMVQIPEALQECHWDIDTSSEQPVYLLHRNAGVEASVAREGEERRAEIAVRQQQLRREAIEEVRRALAMSPEELKELEKTDILLARAAQYPSTRELMEAYVSLPQENLDQLIETGRLEFNYNEAPPAIRKAVGVGLQLQHRYLAWTQAQQAPLIEEVSRLEEQTRQLENQIATESYTDMRVSIRDFSGREIDWGTLLSVTSDDYNAHITLVPARFTRMTFAGNPYEWLLTETGDSSEVARQTLAQSAQTWSKLREERQWNESEWVEPTDPRLHSRLELPLSGEEGAGFIKISELQQIIAAEIGLSIVSDYFTEDNAFYSGSPSLGDSLWRDLYILGKGGGFKWQLVGDCLVFHRTMWHWLAAQELPESLLAKYRERLAQQGRFTLDDVIAFVVETKKEFTAWDRRGLSIPPDLYEAGLVSYGFGNRPLLLYSSLTQDEKAMARSAEGLSFAALWESGRRDLEDYLPFYGRRSNQTMSETDLWGVHFFLDETIVEEGGGAFTEYTFRYTFPEEAAIDERFFNTSVRLPVITKETSRMEE